MKRINTQRDIITSRNRRRRDDGDATPASAGDDLVAKTLAINLGESHPSLEINRSSRHAKIAGDFGETLVLYWLSKHGFECACVDHTGIDLIALNPHTNERMGISVKSRTRKAGSENKDVNLPADNFDKVVEACKAFGCQPYFAIVVDGAANIRAFITPMARVLQLVPLRPSGSGWRMSASHQAKYVNDPQIMTFEMQVKSGRWWQ